MKIILVVGARPNFIKVAPLISEFKKTQDLKCVLVNTGQHYDYELSKVFLEELDIPIPDINLEVGSGTHSEQTAKVMVKFEKVLLEEKPDLVVVFGDVNSSLACALAAAKLHIKVAHTEAGCRSFDKRMPEEINRVLTDHLSDYLFTISRDDVCNLIREGIPLEKILFSGNVMIDTLIQNIDKISKSNILESLNLKQEQYALLTLHRAANVDNEHNLNHIVDILKHIQEKIKIIFPIHPRTKQRISEFNLEEKIKTMKNLIITEPLSYIKFLSLVNHSKFVLTDSGGIQAETTYLKVPCITMREKTEHLVTIEFGSNILTGLNKEKILEAVSDILEGRFKKANTPELWDGKTAGRIVDIIYKSLKDN